MPSKKLNEFLDKHEVPYITITHSQAFTAQKVAASAHIPGKNMVNTVMVKPISRRGVSSKNSMTKENFWTVHRM